MLLFSVVVVICSYIFDKQSNGTSRTVASDSNMHPAAASYKYCKQYYVASAKIHINLKHAE